MSDKEKVKEEVENAAESTVEPVQLTINDLRGLAAVIELASQRGAFQASEMAQVGSYYNQLAVFLGQFEAANESDSADEGE